LNVPGKAQVNHPAIGNPEIGPYARCNNEKKNRNPKQDQDKPGNPIAPANSNPQGSSPFRREKTPVTRIILNANFPLFPWMRLRV
jgi:hypothetical protein